MILDDIKNALEAVDPNVFYGAVDISIKDSAWDYIVFNRSKRKESPNRTGCSYFYSVHIVRENFVPEEDEEAVLENMLAIAGMKRTDEDATYSYIVKPNTNVVIEMVSINFVRAKKAK